MSNDVLQVGQSALYPALHKLERAGLDQIGVGQLGNESPLSGTTR
jgi:DNA-binding PadR family transcriptional regulator